MSSTSRSELIRLSGELAKQASLIDLRLRKIDAELLTPVVKEPLTLSLANFHRAMSKLTGHVIYDFTYEIEGNDEVGQRVFRASLILSLIFKFKEDRLPSAPALRAFGAIGVVDVAHPYVRELVHSLSWRMGLPPLVLEVSPPET